MDSPANIETLTAALVAERDRAVRVEAELALARARNADDAATIARQNLEIAKLKRQIYGPRSERTARLLDQMELELEELEAAASEDEIAAERAAAQATNVTPFTRKRPSRQPFPDHLLSTGTELSANVGVEFSLGDGDGVGRWISRLRDPVVLFRVGGPGVSAGAG